MHLYNNVRPGACAVQDGFYGLPQVALQYLRALCFSLALLAHLLYISLEPGNICALGTLRSSQLAGATLLTYQALFVIVLLIG